MLVNVLHRDLKLGNMLLTENMTVKIADFGLACIMEGKISAPYFTLYLAPWKLCGKTVIFAFQRTSLGRCAAPPTISPLRFSTSKVTALLRR